MVPARGQLAGRQADSGAVQRTVAERLRRYALRLTHRVGLARFIDDLTVGGSHFLPEMVILGLKRGLRIIEVPVNYRDRIGESKITGSFKGTVRTGVNMIILALRCLT